MTVAKNKLVPASAAIDEAAAAEVNAGETVAVALTVDAGAFGAAAAAGIPRPAAATPAAPAAPAIRN